MGYRQRIEKAVVAMFEFDREMDEYMCELAKTIDEDVSYPDQLCNIALDLLGMPNENMDNRASFYRMWTHDAKTAKEFIDSCYEFLKNRQEVEL